MVCLRRIHWMLALLALSAFAVANEGAEELLESYEKKDVVELLLKKCYGEVTINNPFPKRVYGRPPAGQVDRKTLAHDMKRCKFDVEDAHAYFERRGALRRRSSTARVVGGASSSSSRSSSSSASGASSSSSLQGRLRKLERKQRERERAEAIRRREGERELEQARRAGQSTDERDKEKRVQQCKNAREMRNSYREHATNASTVKMREEYRKLADELQGAIRTNCKSVL